MPFLLLLIGALGVAATVAVIYWERCLQWAETSLFPWVRVNVPTLEASLRSAFSRLNAAASRVRRAWTELRRYLLKQTIELLSKTVSTWSRRVISYLIRVQNGQSAPMRRVEEQDIAFEDLPEDVQTEIVRTGKKTLNVDVTRARDAEVLEMAH